MSDGADQRETPPRDDYDPAEARQMLGAYVLIGITVNDHDGTPIEHFQLHGTVRSIDPKRGITVHLAGSRSGETYTLPPSTAAFTRASPGQYRLKTTGEVIEDPDYTTTWTVTRPDPAEG